MITSDFVAYVISATTTPSSLVSKNEITERLTTLMIEIARECDAIGATLIGHIKCVLDANEYLAVSVTDASGHASVRGDLTNDIDHVFVVINAMLYGLTYEQVKSIVDELVIKHLSFDTTVRIEELDKKQSPIHFHC